MHAWRFRSLEACFDKRQVGWAVSTDEAKVGLGRGYSIRAAGGSTEVGGMDAVSTEGGEGGGGGRCLGLRVSSGSGWVPCWDFAGSTEGGTDRLGGCDGSVGYWSWDEVIRQCCVY